jgi:hypothetical protein
MMKSMKWKLKNRCNLKNGFNAERNSTKSIIHGNYENSRSLVESLSKFSSDFMIDREQPDIQIRT